MEKVKYTVMLPGKIAEKIDEISEIECISKPEVLRRAIALYSYIHREIEDGGKLCLIDEKNDQSIKEIIF